jgi:hypothetical protein
MVLFFSAYVTIVGLAYAGFIGWMSKRDEESQASDDAVVNERAIASSPVVPTRAPAPLA